MTTTSDDLMQQVVAALLGPVGGPPPTAANQNVFAPRDWPTDLGNMPVILVQSPKEVKDSIGRTGAPQFTVTSCIRLVGRMTSPAETGDAGAGAVQAALGTLQRQIEVAVINYTPLMLLLQQFARVEVTNTVTSDAEQHVGQLNVDLYLEFYQGPEDFCPTAYSALDQMAIYDDLVNVFDPNGTYDNPPFPNSVVPAPRTHGPDGRLEGSLLLNLNEQVITTEDDQAIQTEAGADITTEN